MCKHFKLSYCPHYRSTQFIINLSFKLLIYGAVSHIKSEYLLQVITSWPHQHIWLNCYSCTSSIIFLVYCLNQIPSVMLPCVALRQSILLCFILHLTESIMMQLGIKNKKKLQYFVNVCSNCRPQRIQRILLGRERSILSIYPQAMPGHSTKIKAPGVRLRNCQHKNTNYA